MIFLSNVKFLMRGFMRIINQSNQVPVKNMEILVKNFTVGKLYWFGFSAFPIRAEKFDLKDNLKIIKQLKELFFVKVSYFSNKFLKQINSFTKILL